METQRPHVAIFPSPGLGHLIPLAAFAQQLATIHGFSVTFINVSTGSSPMQDSILAGLEQTCKGFVKSVELPMMDMSDIPPDTGKVVQISLTIRRSLGSLRGLLGDLFSGLPTATGRFPAISGLIADPFCADVIELTHELQLPTYLFFTSTATLLSLMLHLPTLDQEISGEYRDLDFPVQVPGCFPIPGKDLPEQLQDREDEEYAWFLRHARKYIEAKSILINTFQALEPHPIKTLRDKRHGGRSPPKIVPVGPLTLDLPDNPGEECLKWLDEQPLNSVLFVCFGSGGTFTHEQMNEMAMGLEASEQRFLWVIRKPHQTSSSASFFSSTSNGEDPLAFLPLGFVSRIQGRGLVIPDWAPQGRILAHSSIGGFMSHCGWNSTLESVKNGVPMIAWPLYAEQRMNALMLANEIKVALRPKMEDDGIVYKHEIERAVRCLMEEEEGKLLREKMGELKTATDSALAKGGTSYESVNDVAEEWRFGSPIWKDMKKVSFVVGNR
ncbi:LOW QUALITY PROTEIN: UDP-glycosyltransferase 72B1 [Amborella trichopoda]|uniref:LOW QUALITY PROTEIN: UDP-glycosyltransferase 72B1 n=1 Tax=Amborella trichopoda TaxID=13333 RepID=UPI0009C1684D|nr:LOW QUALITY PROTEIN: UDP-glycosyltransferase 72B1 [Amborella trichopoda]|eukprot:XP_011621644.2 LOW QUALITY PROTEIN: UDP-glycosyltransferase 72B1 [Amborella trichopoda]